MKLLSIVLLLFLIIVCIDKSKCQTSITLTGLIFDETPSRNPDFEASSTGVVIKGLVKATLGTDNTPDYCCGNTRKGTITNATTFYSWFHSVPGVNIPISKNLVLTQDPTNPNLYTYQNLAFFPIDGQGFDNKTLYPNERVYLDNLNKAHNFHFCMQVHTDFTYRAGDIFTFAGDDDVWVFINNKLAVDLGSTHPSASSSINLDTLGLTSGQNYPFDFFYCERHTDMSTIRITTTLRFVCPKFDECGICEGDGSTCCTSTNCDNNPAYVNNCIQAKCIGGVCNVPVANCTSTVPCFDSVCVSGKGCQLVPRNCVIVDHCTQDVCNTTINACQHNTIPNCVNCPGTACITTDKCNPQACSTADGKSCVTVPKNCDDNNYCTTDSCVNGVCFHQAIDSCDNCLGAQKGCITDDFCKPYRCSPDKSTCFNDTLNCNDNNGCTTDYCTEGVCFYDNVPNCLNCKGAACNTTDQCQVVSCSADGNSCVTVPKNCNDNNYCTTDSCFGGVCSYILISDKCINCAQTGCITTDLCNPQVCSADGTTCIDNPVVCNDNDYCTTDTCSQGQCSYTRTPNCISCSNTSCIILDDKCQVISCSADGLTCVTNPKTCTDNNYCTNDSCVSPFGSCSYTPIPFCVSCLTKNCITMDFCKPQICSVDGTSCIDNPINCDDKDVCTTEHCSNGVCHYENIDNCFSCNNGAFNCITTDFCNEKVCPTDPSSTTCEIQPKLCDDKNPCSTDTCESPSGNCMFTPIDKCTVCSTSLGCTTIDNCKLQICSTDNLLCIDGDNGCKSDDLCTIATCQSPSGVCSKTPKDCEDGDECNVNGCVNGTCTATPIANCNDCKNIGCITTDFCQYQVCSTDGASCSTNPVSCNDNNFCTNDASISPAGFCQHTQIPNCINCAGIGCTTTTDFCQIQVCSADGLSCVNNPVNCDDKDACTNDRCDSSDGFCHYTKISNCLNCNNGAFSCITTDFCNNQICPTDPSSTTCVTQPKVCDDLNPCSTDTCESPTGNCLFTPIDKCTVCSTTLGCIQTDLCITKTCSVTNTSCDETPFSCNDFNNCTIGSCLNGICTYVPVPECENCNNQGTLGCVTQNLCKPNICDINNSNETCIEMDKDCSDGNYCTEDLCDYNEATQIPNCSNSPPLANCLSCNFTKCVTIDLCIPQICSPDGTSCIDNPVNCDDKDPCTKDSCLNGSCSSTPIDFCQVCSETFSCPVFSNCSVSKCSNDNLSCIITNKICNDNNVCTEDYCNHLDGSCFNIFLPECVPCGNSSCKVTNYCFPPVCINSTFECSNNTVDCDDNDPCSKDECFGGTCRYEDIPNCKICSPSLGCVSDNPCEPKICDKNNTVCTITMKNCSDGNPCTQDSCKVIDGTCLSTFIENCEVCSPDFACITDNKCEPSICDGPKKCITSVANCSDIFFCTDDQCLNGACVNTPIKQCTECPFPMKLLELETSKTSDAISKPAKIKSSKLVTIIEATTPSHGCINEVGTCSLTSCDPNGGGCITSPIICEDSSPCTEDSCSNGTCYYLPIPHCNVCSNDFACISTDPCNELICLGTNQCSPNVTDCNDYNECTTDTCIFGSECSNLIIPGCVLRTNSTTSTSSTSTTTGIIPPIEVRVTTGMIIPNPCNCDEGQICIELIDRNLCITPNTRTIGHVDTGGRTTTTSSTIGRCGSSGGSIGGSGGTIATNGNIEYPEISTIGGGGTIAHYTESGTGINTDPCKYHNCDKGLQCEVIKNKAECVPENYKCLDCLDILCHEQGMSCYMIENPHFIPHKRCKNDASLSCCKFLPTCKQYKINTSTTSSTSTKTSRIQFK